MPPLQYALSGTYFVGDFLGNMPSFSEIWPVAVCRSALRHREASSIGKLLKLAESI